MFICPQGWLSVFNISTIRFQYFDYTLGAFRVVVRACAVCRCRLSSLAEKASSKGGEISYGVLWDREVDISLPRNCNYLDFHVDAQAQKLKT